jgi:hypothetical protein
VKPNWVIIKDNEGWLVENDTFSHRYRVSYFEDDGHFVDEVIFHEYRK